MFKRHRKDMQAIVRKKIADLKTKRDLIFGTGKDAKSFAPVRLIQDNRMELLHEWLANVIGDVKVKRAKVKRTKLKVVA